jgi:hypothetical protein
MRALTAKRASAKRNTMKIGRSVERRNDIGMVVAGRNDCGQYG